MDWILICKLCKFGKYTCYNFRDIKFFLGGYFFWRDLYIVSPFSYIIANSLIVLNAQEIISVSTVALGRWQQIAYIAIITISLMSCLCVDSSLERPWQYEEASSRFFDTDVVK